MANRRNFTTEQIKSKAAKPRNSTRISMSWQSIGLSSSLIIVLASCLIWLPQRLNSLVGIIFSSAFGAVLITPYLPSLLVSVFCGLALYLLLTKRGIGKFATISTLIFTAVALCFIMGGILGAGRVCGEFDCSTANTLRFYALFLYNPFANLLWNTLAITGIALLVRRLK